MRNPASVAIAMLLFLSCASADNESWLISEQQEIQMGAEYHAQLLAEMPEYKGSAVVTNYVNEMGSALALNSGRPNLPYHFTVVDSDEVNAFAVMGGFVYVTTGLLKMSGSASEVATILAHELGHISARHGVRAMETYMIEQGLTSLLFKEGQTKELVTAALSTLTTLTFSKDQEREADSLGVQYAAATKWNPWGIVDFFNSLEILGATSADPDSTLSKIGELFSTHPSNPERISNVSTELGQMGIAKDSPGYSYGRATEDASFANVKAILGG